MTKRGLVNWAIWISVMSGIYCAIYFLTIGTWTMNSFIPGNHIMQVTFTALPIFFIAGAKRAEFKNFCGSYVIGVLWGMLYLFLMDRLAAAGVPVWLTIGLVVAVVCTVECAVHFVLPASLPFNVVPAQFGAVSNTFWASGLASAVLGPGESATFGFYNFTPMPIVMITLCTGALLALICNEGLHFIDPETGNWTMPKKKDKALSSDNG